MSTKIQETINRLRELDQKASPAPWEAWGCGEDKQTSIEHPMGDVLERSERGSGHMREDITWLREDDANLIIETRNAIPTLLAEIDRLTAENKNLTAELAEAWEDGYADAICDVEGVYAFDRDELTKTPNPYEEDKK